MVGTQAKQSFETGSKVEHNLLIYGGLGDLVNKKVLPALEPLRREFNIKYALVDTADVGPDTYYCYGTEPIKSYNAAVIAVPNYLHEEVAMKAMNNGLNLLCEKPIAHTLESAKRIVIASRRHPELTCMMSDHFIYKPAVRFAMDNWEELHDQIGEIKSVTARILEHDWVTGRFWLFIEKLAGGGIGIDTGIHLVAIMGKLFGYQDLKPVQAEMDKYPNSPGDAETHMTICLKTKNEKITITVEVGKYYPGENQKSITINGSDATLEINVGNGSVMLNGKFEKQPTSDTAYIEVYREFFSAMEEGRKPFTTLEEGYRTLRIIKNAYKVAAPLRTDNAQ